MNQLGWPVSNNEIYLMELFVSLNFAFENCIVQFLKSLPFIVIGARCFGGNKASKKIFLPFWFCIFTPKVGGLSPAIGFITTTCLEERF